MEIAIQVMNKSIQKPRKDKVSSKVGAVIIKTDAQKIQHLEGSFVTVTTQSLHC